VQSRCRISRAEEAHWRPGTLSRHHPSWLDDHSSPTNVGSWNIANRAVTAHWRHGAHHRITQCPTGYMLPTVSTGSRQSPCVPSHTFFVAASLASVLAVTLCIVAPSLLPPSAPIGGDPSQPGSPPTSNPPCHAAWSFYVGKFSNGSRGLKKETNLECPP
jgi:hypothetical protein